MLWPKPPGPNGKKSFASFLQKRRAFFLERKKQRTFACLRGGAPKRIQGIFSFGDDHRFP
jgi:hypothetical protein